MDDLEAPALALLSRSLLPAQADRSSAGAPVHRPEQYSPSAVPTPAKAAAGTGSTLATPGWAPVSAGRARCLSIGMNPRAG